MKKLILSCLLMLCAGTMMATEPAIFAKASGSSTCYLLSKTPQVTIADGKATLTVDSETKLEVTLADDATLEITFGECLDCNVTSAKYATIYSSKNLVVPTGVKVFAPTYNEEKSVLTMNDAITEGTVIAGEKGYIVYAESDDYLFAATNETATAGSGSCLIGYEEDTDQDGVSTYYSLANGSTGIGFYKYKAGNKLKAGKAYLALAAGAKLDGILFDEGGGTTAINNVTMDENGQYIIYDLNGRRVTKMEKGQIYVIGNKKYLIK